MLQIQIHNQKEYIELQHYSQTIMSERKAIAITTPSNNDVLLEKGLRAQRHPGNIQYRNIIQEKALEYSIAEKRIVKDNIAHSIFNRVRGRFLTREDGYV